MASLFGSNVVSQVAAAIGVPSRTVAAAKDIPNAVNSGIGVPFNPKADAEERAGGGGMKMQRVTAAGAAKAKPNDAIARQFGM
jgi:hypothetical protein